jgi:hypothetical protein
VIRTSVLERRERPAACQEVENRPKSGGFLPRARDHSWMRREPQQPVAVVRAGTRGADQGRAGQSVEHGCRRSH